MTIYQVERSIADFFIYNREEMDFSAKAVAGKLFVSEAPCPALPRSAVLKVTVSSFTSTGKTSWSSRSP